MFSSEMCFDKVNAGGLRDTCLLLKFSNFRHAVRFLCCEILFLDHEVDSLWRRQERPYNLVVAEHFDLVCIYFDFESLEIHECNQKRYVSKSQNNNGGRHINCSMSLIHLIKTTEIHISWHVPIHNDKLVTSYSSNVQLWGRRGPPVRWLRRVRRGLKFFGKKTRQRVNASDFLVNIGLFMTLYRKSHFDLLTSKNRISQNSSPFYHFYLCRTRALMTRQGAVHGFYNFRSQTTKTQ